MKINKEMADHLIRWNTEYDHSKYNKPEIRDIFILLKYLKEEIEKLNANKPETE